MVIGTLNTDSTKICHTAEKDKVINLKCRRWMSTRGVTCAHAHKASHIGHIFLGFSLIQITYCGARQRKWNKCNERNVLVKD